MDLSKIVSIRLLTVRHLIDARSELIPWTAATPIQYIVIVLHVRMRRDGCSLMTGLVRMTKTRMTKTKRSGGASVLQCIRDTVNLCDLSHVT